MKTTLVLLLSVIALNAADPVRPGRPERPAPITAKSLGKTYVITLRDGTKLA